MSKNATLTVDDLIDIIQRDDSGQEKLAYSQNEVEESAQAELLEKIASEMDEKEVLKQAAAAKVSGNIMADIIFDKVASGLTPVVVHAVQEKIASLLPQLIEEVLPRVVEQSLEKQAIGTSSAIAGNLSSSSHNKGSANDLQMKEDSHGRGAGSQVDKYLHTAETHGASVSGGGSAEGGAGTKMTNLDGSMVHKMSSFNPDRVLIQAEQKKDAYLAKVAAEGTYQDYLQAKVEADQYMNEVLEQIGNFQKKAELDADLARYQELEAKAQAGTLTPEEQAEYEMLLQKLMAAAGQGGAPGMGAEAGPPPEAAPPEAGGAPMGAMGGSMMGGNPTMGMGGSYGNEEEDSGDTKEEEQEKDASANNVSMVKTLIERYNLR